MERRRLPKKFRSCTGCDAAFETANTAYTICGACRRKIRQARRETPEGKIKHAAHLAVTKAIRVGTLIRPQHCEKCRSDWQKIHAHHDDYSKPLDVLWLCASCHRTHHTDKSARLHGPRWRLVLAAREAEMIRVALAA